MSLTFSFTFLDFLAFKHAECPLKRFKRPAAVIKTDYSRETFLHRPREVCYITYTNNVCLCQAATGGKINSTHAESLMFVTHWARHKRNAI